MQIVDVLYGRKETDKCSDSGRTEVNGVFKLLFSDSFPAAVFLTKLKKALTHT